MINKCSYCNCSLSLIRKNVSHFDDQQKTCTLLKCHSCGLIFTYPDIDAKNLSLYYSKEYYGTHDEKFVFGIENLTSWLNKRLSIKIYKQYISQANVDKKVRVLDIGCGRGLLLKHFNSLGCECYGVERKGVFKTEKRDNVNYYTNSLHEIKFPQNSFDIVILWHVLEHIQDPNKLIIEVKRILKTNGFLWVAVPNFESFQSKIFDNYWFHLDLPRHRVHFSIDSLKTLLKSSSLEIKEYSTFSFEQNIYGFLQSLMNKISLKEQNHKFYQQIKKNNKYFSLPAFIKGVLTVFILIPLALIEYLFSGFLKKGSVLICKIRPV